MDSSPKVSGEMLKQAEHIWKMLDELAVSDPEAYKNFVQRSMNEKKKEISMPEPFLCLKTDILMGTSKRTPLFVNICSWTKVPAPKTNSDAVPVTGGPLEEKQSKSGSYKVTRVAINPDVLKECSEKKEGMTLLINLIFQFLENQHKINISGKHSVAKETFHGDKAALIDFFGPKEKRAKTDPEESAPQVQDLSPEILLARMSQSDEKDLPDLRLATEPVNEMGKGKVLIEEISSECITLPTPEYELSVKEKDDKKARRCVLRIALPGVAMVKECDLQIDSREVSLHVEGKYSLAVSIPEPFHEEDVSAKFIKKSSTLSVTLPLKDKMS